MSLLILMTLAGMALAGILSACGTDNTEPQADGADSRSETDGEDHSDGTGDGDTVADNEAQAVDPAADLSFTATDDGAVCDGIRREIGVIENAQAYEPLDFDAPDSPFVLVGEALGDGSFPLYWTCLPSEGNREWRVTVEGTDSGKTLTFPVVGRLPPPARPGGIDVDVVTDPFSCDGEKRVVAELSNLTPNVEIDFDVQPEADPIVVTQADADGNLTIDWECTAEDVPTSWVLVALEATPEPQRRASFRFTATNEPYKPPADIVVSEDPFVCDGEVREFAVISGFIPDEFITFTSPQTGNLRGGNADDDGELPIRWQCDPDQAGTEWEVTADGGISLATVTFTIVGAEP